MVVCIVLYSNLIITIWGDKVNWIIWKVCDEIIFIQKVTICQRKRNYWDTFIIGSNIIHACLVGWNTTMALQRPANEHATNSRSYSSPNTYLKKHKHGYQVKAKNEFILRLLTQYLLFYILVKQYSFKSEKTSSKILSAIGV